MKKYYLNGQTSESDTLSFEQLKSNGLQTTDFVWFEGLEAWKPVSEIEELIPLIKKTVVPPLFHNPTPPHPHFQQEKSTPTETHQPLQTPKPTMANNKKLYIKIPDRFKFWLEFISTCIVLTIFIVGVWNDYFDKFGIYIMQQLTPTNTYSEHLTTMIGIWVIIGLVYILSLVYNEYTRPY